MTDQQLPTETGALIVGAGPIGLTASALLSKQGIPNLVVERRTETQRAPAAHVLRHRTMEVFDRLGIGSKVREATPRMPLDTITWCATFGGSEVGRLDLRVGLEPGEDVWTNCPQNLLEPILLDHVRQESHARVVQGAECIGVEQDLDRVRATVRLADQSEPVVEARWMIAADGAGSRLRKMLDIPMVGPGAQGRFFMVHVEADLRPWMEGRSGPIFWIMSPETPGTLIVHDPAKSHVFMTMNFGQDGEEAAIPERLRKALAIDVDLRILSVDAWSPMVQVAERYREGRVFLAGDAAHRFPPSGGLGLNTGILDVDHLVYHLAQVEGGHADASTLDQYEVACRPAAQENADASFGNLRRLGEINKVLGPHADLASLEQRLASLRPDEAAQLAAAVERQRSHFVSDGFLPPEPGSVD